MKEYKRLYYKLARNNKKMVLEAQEELASNLKKGDEIYIITKNGIEKDKLKSKKVYTEKNLFLLCKEHRICAKDIGYTVFTSKKEAKKRLKALKPEVNRVLLKYNKLDLTEAFEYAKIIEGYIDNYSNGLDKLDKKYPVSGHFWDYDPNDRMVVLDKEWTSNDKSLNRQVDCVNGKHMLVKLTGTLYWCQNCGTVIKTRKQMEVSKRNPFNKVEKDNDEYYYPMSPHFLPKKKNK